MSKIGFKKNTIHSSEYEKTSDHKYVQGRTYEIENPSVKLLNMIGGGFFNEPRYYDSNRTSTEFYTELSKTGKISSRILDEMSLTEQAKEVIETAQAVANSDNPEDLLILAAWARDPKHGLKLRTTPQILLAIAAANPKTKEFVRRYCPSIMRRADEPAQVLAAFIHLFQGKTSGRRKGTIPASLRKGAADAYAKYSLYSILKYDNQARPTIKDTLKLIDRKKGRPFSDAVLKYITDRVITEDTPELIKARHYFFNTVKSVQEVNEELIKTASLTWENITSHLGSSKEVWELCIPMMPEMALTRNLRNFEQAGISDPAWDKVYAKIEKITNTKQLPFRFFTAAKHTTSTAAQTAAAIQLDKACAQLPDLPGVTVALVDNSGSALGAPVSGKSDLRVSDCGNILGAVLAKRFGRRAKIGVFGDSIVWVPFSQADSALTIKNKIDSVAQVEDRAKNGALGFPQFKSGYGVGARTETGLWWAIHDLIERGVKVDRFVLLSDLCCYTQGDVNCRVDMRAFGKDGHRATMQGMFSRYRAKVNPNAKVYSVNLSGYGQSQMDPKDKKNYIMSGWSEQIFSLIRDVEDLEAVQANQQTKTTEAPTLEVLRGKYGVNVKEPKIIGGSELGPNLF